MTWWLDLVFARLGDVREDTRDLVRILDLREFSKDTYEFATDQTWKFFQSIHFALKLLPRVNALLLDGHTAIDPSALISLTSTHSHPLLLSLSGCATRLPTAFYSTASLQKLVYLDISGDHGSILPLAQSGLLPDLRILKLRGREVDDNTFGTLASSFKRRLWSWDLARNRISDAIIPTLVQLCFSPTNLHSDAYFRVEGNLQTTGYGSADYGEFVFIDESAWSAKNNHPERYFLDAPTYNAQPYTLHQQQQVFRSDMRAALRQDSADGAAETLSQDTLNYDIDDTFRVSRGVTHLSLSNNQLSAVGLERLLRTSRGHLERLECDYMPLLPSYIVQELYWPLSAKLYGILGMSHAFRPVFSSNLQSLRIHHSLVTNVPTLEVDGFSALSRLYLAENAIRSRVDDAFPVTYVPDMNPRIMSLTLTCVPRRSSGSVIERLIEFLKLLSHQERDIQDSSTITSSWRWPGMLQGLRHLRLEFEPDPMEEGFSATEDLDAEELMNAGERGYSFFEDENPEKKTAETKSRRPKNQDTSATSSSDSETLLSSKLAAVTISMSRDNQDFVDYAGEWNGRFSIPVWVGRPPSSSPPNPIVEEYRQLVLEQRLYHGVGPVTPSQIAAGVPGKCFIFHTAWCAAIMPRHLVAPAVADLAGMRDVLDALKQYRVAGRVKYLASRKNLAHPDIILGDPHLFWTGQLEVTTRDAMAQAQPSRYWR